MREGTLRDRDKLAYVAIAVVLGTLIRSFRSTPWSREVLLFDLASVVVGLGGIFFCYSMNRRGDGRQFVERYALLSVPLYLSTYVLFFSLYYGMGILAALGRLEHWPWRTATGTASLLALAISYWWLGKLMLRASSPRVG
jgi:hypothetical protein